MIISKPGTSLTIKITGKVSEYKSGTAVEELRKEFTTQGGSKKVSFVIPVKEAKLWSPEKPFLYTLNLSTGADD